MIKLEINQKVGKKLNKKWLSKIIKSTLKMVDVKQAEISIAFVGEKKIKELNRRYRRKNKITDVLSFTYQIQNTKYKIPLVGEIIICYPQAVRQARERGHGAKEEIKTLLVHGLLHLCGHEHEKGAKEAEKMRRMEKIVLEKIKNKI